MGTKIKTKLKQLLCRHREKTWMEKQTMFFSLSGDTHYLICKKCGKELDQRTFEHEGNGYK